MMGVDGFLPKDYLPAASKFVESSLVWEILSIVEGRSLRAIACNVGTGHAVLKQAAVRPPYLQPQMPVNIQYMNDKNNLLK